MAAAFLFAFGFAEGADLPPPPLRAPAFEKPSAIETAYSERAGIPLRQYGYELFGTAKPVPITPAGAAQDDYLLGTGDELTFTLRGKHATTRRHVIGLDGRVVIDEIRPVPAAGLTLGELRRQLEAELAATSPQTELFLSLTSVRRMGVLVLGEVAQPGRHEVAGFASLMDALMTAGGVTRSGSLRRIQLVRGGTSQTVDLYALFEGAGDGDPRLRDGDRIVVPPLGPTFAISGPVKRPGIYELPLSEHQLSLDEALGAAGGLLLPGAPRIVRLAIGQNGAETASEIGFDRTESVAEGDLLLIAPKRDIRLGSVVLAGHVRHPGPRALTAAETLAGLIGSADLLPGPYLPFAVLETTDSKTLARVLLPIDLQTVLEGREDRLLSDDDKLIVLGASDIDFLTAAPVLSLLRGQSPAVVPACAGVTVLARALAADSEGILARGPLARAATELVPADLPCPPVFDRHPDLLVFALEHAVLMRRGVTRPGFYPVAGSSNLDGLARTAGKAGEKLAVVDGLAGRPWNTGTGTARHGDIVDSVTPRFELVGHVRHPGTRLLTGGATLRSVVSHGDQLLPGAYPLFGVIDRYDRTRLTRTLVPFAPRDVIAGRADRALANGDRVHLFSADEIRQALDSVSGVPEASGRPVGAEAAALPDEAIRKLMAEQAVSVRGAVRQPGMYPVAESVSVETIVAAAGGPTGRADSRSVEVTTRPDTPGAPTLSARRRVVALHGPDGDAIEVRPGDAVRVNPMFSDIEAKAIVIGGEVRRPGEYDVIRGERLSSLIERAGGLTAQAYPAGAVFTRESARRQETQAFERAAQELDRGLALVLLKERTPSAEQINLARQLADQLRTATALGRITVEADPAVLALRPDLDIVLEPGDRIVIPKRPLTVTVSGEVLAPASLQFAPEKTADAYVHEAGGMTRYADSSRAFVVLPNGSAQPLRISFWDHAPVSVLPGSTIIVPRDPEPFNFLEFSKSIGSILSQLAISAASIAVLADR